MTYGRGYGRMYNLLDPTGTVVDLGIEITAAQQSAEDALDNFEPDEKYVLLGLRHSPALTTSSSERRILASWRPLERQLELKKPEALVDEGIAREVTNLVRISSPSYDTLTLIFALADRSGRQQGEVRRHALPQRRGRRLAGGGRLYHSRRSASAAQQQVRTRLQSPCNGQASPPCWCGVVGRVRVANLSVTLRLTRVQSSAQNSRRRDGLQRRGMAAVHVQGRCTERGRPVGRFHAA